MEQRRRQKRSPVTLETRFRIQKAFVSIVFFVVNGATHPKTAIGFCDLGGCSALYDPRSKVTVWATRFGFAVLEARIQASE